jgi:hypothetical protein
MFDYAQPCLRSETVDVPVPTRRLPDGRHSLAISVTDAAQNASTVLDRTITTFNPQITPSPRRGIKMRFVISWHWVRGRTRLRSITTRRAPRRGRVRIVCLGRRCLTFTPHSVGIGHLKRLLHGMHDKWLRARDRLRIIVSAPHRRSERIQLTIRRGRKPLATLLGRHDRRRRAHRRG